MFDSRNNRFVVVNAFAMQRFGGNPAAIFPHAARLTDEEMQLIARQLNLVETVFILPSTEKNIDRELRYFTPSKELPIAGHPTVAAWIALAHEGEIVVSERTKYSQRTQAGVQLIEIKAQDEHYVISMEQQPAKFLAVATDRAHVAQVFGIKESDLVEAYPIQAIDTGLGHIIVPLKNLDALMRVRRNIDALQNLCASLHVREAQLYCMEAQTPGIDLHTRNLCPRDGIEDPACGVGNGALGAYLARYHYQAAKEISFKAEQGYIVNMPSVIEVTVVPRGTEYQIFIGGSGLVMLKGSFEQNA